MRVCLNCGKNIRDGADFCPSCGAPAPAPQYTGGQNTYNSADFGEQTITTDVPLITLAPEHAPMTRQRLKRTGKLFAGVTAVILLVIVGIFAAAYLGTDPFKQNPFETESESLSSDSYNQCLALVRDVRNDNFDSLINDIIQMEGDFENYNFLSAYEGLFKEIVPDDSSDEMAVKFRNCCFMVAYTEFTAKKFESYSSSGFLASLYVDDADTYRAHADKLWEDLNNAQTDAHLQNIIDYCEEHDIIRLKDAPASSQTGETTESTAQPTEEEPVADGE